MALFPSLRNVRGFFSDYYLGTVFGRTNGRRRTLVTREVEKAFRTASRIVERAETRGADAPSVREELARPLLRDVFGFHVGAGEDRIHPLFVSADQEAADEPPLLLAYVGEWAEDLDAGRTPPTRALGHTLAQSNADLPYGLLVTGERLRLVRREGEGPRGAYLELDVTGCLETEDLESLAAARRMFSAPSFSPREDGTLPIQEVEHESREHAERVSDDLKEAVFRSAETLVQGLLVDLAAREGVDSVELPADRLAAYRDAALIFLYRVLFILYAEAREEYLLDHRLYRDAYSLDELVRRLGSAGGEPAANATGIWQQLRALFAIHHRGLPGAEGFGPIPARGGELFDPETPAGRILGDARLDDRTTARVLLDLAMTAPRRGVGRERISFRELDIEQLGAVYEGLLEYEPRIAEGPTIEVRVQGRSYALVPAELARLCREKDLTLKGDPVMVEGTEAAAFHPEAAIDEDEPDEDAPDEEGEVKKGGSARLLRRLERGAFHFVPGAARKGSGSFYTPLPLVRDLVHHALGPLVEGRTAEEIESLRVLDPACGSAHFLVEAMRYLGRALHRAYVKEHGGNPPPRFRGRGRGWDEDWEASDAEARASASEARAWCKRRIAERCLFGVDLNSTAVDLARVALWIESLAGDRPLTYFEHHVRCGNSILGTWLERLGTPPLPSLAGRQPKHGGKSDELFAEPVKDRVREAAEIRAVIDVAADEGAVEPESLEELEFKEDRRQKAERALAGARLLLDLRSASAFVPAIWRDWPGLADRASDPQELEAHARSKPWWESFREVREREPFFHWELEFPEVFLREEKRGFDAVLGNPPWDKVKPDRKEFYGRHDVLIRALVGGVLDRRIRELHTEVPGLEQAFGAYEHQVKIVAACLKKGGDYEFQDWEVDGKTTGGDPDAFKYFVERAWQLAADRGRVGLVVPSAIYNNEGCTGLRHLLLREAQVERFYAFENRRKIFPIDSRYKFVSLVFRKGRGGGDGFEAAFMRHDLVELSDGGPKPWIVWVRPAELERLSPGTLAFLEYRSPRDREILLKMYGYDAGGNPVNPRPLLGNQGPGTWNARFHRGLDITNDYELWTDSSGRLYDPRQVLGPISGTTDRPPYYHPWASPEIRERMAEAGFWPLYEGKHIEQFVIDYSPVERWVSLEKAESVGKRKPYGSPRAVFRDIARNTDERSCIAAVLPEKCFYSYTLRAVMSPEVAPDGVVTLLNSFPFDFSVRFRLAGTHLDFAIMGRQVVVPSQEAEALPTLPTVGEGGAGGLSLADQPEMRERIWKSNEAVAKAYGLKLTDLAHVLSSFPVFARKHPHFHAYLQERIGNVALATAER